MKWIPGVVSVRSVVGWGLLTAGLLAVIIGALVGLPEHGAALRSWIDAPLLGRHERPGALRWWLTPVETNAFARRVTTTASLNDVAVVDGGLTVFVVGDDGALLKSENAGATWRSLSNNVNWGNGMLPGDSEGPTPESAVITSRSPVRSRFA